MRAHPTLSIAVVAALGLIAGSAVWSRYNPPSALAKVPRIHRPVPPRPDTPFERALRQGWEHRTRARLAELREREAVEAWDPAVTDQISSEGLRREQLPQDRGGHLHRARAKTLEAVSLALTPEERWRAAYLRARIECDRGQHERELEQARQLIRLAPEDWRSQDAWQHALVCVGQGAGEGEKTAGR
jgi:hypothetical protein